jgi:hypothetical protein
MPRAAPSKSLTHAALKIVVACRFASRFVPEGNQAFSTKLSCLGRWHSQPWRLFHGKTYRFLNHLPSLSEVYCGA